MILNIFRKKQIKEKTDFSKYKFAINIKSCIAYEQITGKSFFDISTAEDYITLAYCSFVENNDVKITLGAFKVLLEDEEVAKWMNASMEKISKFNAQFNKQNNVEPTSGDSDNGDTKMRITDIATSLIIQYNIDIKYVMNDLDIWMIQHLFQTAENVKKNELIEKRMWAYLTILPHIDGKKINSPEKLLPFEWEKEKNNKRTKKEELDIARAFFKKQNELKEKENGTANINA